MKLRIQVAEHVLCNARMMEVIFIILCTAGIQTASLDLLQLAYLLS